MIGSLSYWYSGTESEKVAYLLQSWPRCVIMLVVQQHEVAPDSLLLLHSKIKSNAVDGSDDESSASLPGFGGPKRQQSVT